MVYVIGAGGHSKQVIDILSMMGEVIDGIVDDDLSKQGQIYYECYEVMTGQLEDIIRPGSKVVIGIGDARIRREICHRLRKCVFINVISPLARISPGAIIGIGNYIGHFTNVNAGVKIGNHNIINDCACLCHDVCIGHFNHLCPGSMIGQCVILGDMNLIGTKSNIDSGIKIRNITVIGSGSSINKDIENGEVVVGVPGRVIKTLISE